MKFLTQEELILGISSVEEVLDSFIDNQNSELILEHLNTLLSIQANVSLLEASSKFLYLKDKKNAELSALYNYCTNLTKAVHYKISGIQSLVRMEISKLNNKI